jgi:hypothetical protein
MVVSKTRKYMHGKYYIGILITIAGLVLVHSEIAAVPDGNFSGCGLIISVLLTI